MLKPRSSILVASARLTALIFALGVLAFLVVTAQRQATVAEPGVDLPPTVSSGPNSEVPALAPAEVPARHAQPFLYSSKSLVVEPAVVESLFTSDPQAASTLDADGYGASPAEQPSAEGAIEPTFLPSSKVRLLGTTFRPLLTPKEGERADHPNQGPR